MSFTKPILSVSHLAAAADYSSKQFYLMTLESGGATLATTAGETVLGPLQNDPESGQAADVGAQGIQKVILGGTVVVGDFLTTNASGAAIAVADQNDYIFGRAIEAGSSGTVIAALMPAGAHRGLSAGTIQLPMSIWQEQDGTALADFADGASPTPGYSAGDEGFGIRWNNHAAPDPISCSVTAPQDLDASQDITVNILAAKIGATLGDAVTWTLEAFNNVDAALYDADTDYGGTSSAMTGDATSKTCQLETLTLDAADLPAAGSQIVFTLQPTDGLLGTDDVILLGVSLSYTRK